MRHAKRLESGVMDSFHRKHVGEQALSPVLLTDYVWNEEIRK
jgi:hypothetical protein